MKSRLGRDGPPEHEDILHLIEPSCTIFWVVYHFLVMSMIYIHFEIPEISRQFRIVFEISSGRREAITVRT